MSHFVTVGTDHINVEHIVRWTYSPAIEPVTDPATDERVLDGEVYQEKNGKWYWHEDGEPVRPKSSELEVVTSINTHHYAHGTQADVLRDLLTNLTIC